MTGWPKQTIRVAASLLIGLGLITGSLWLSGAVEFRKPNLPVDTGTAAAPPAPEAEPLPALDPAVYRAPETVYEYGLNLIFFADGYPSWTEFNNDTNVILDSLHFVAPWNGYGNFNTYQIRPKEVDICTVKTKDERKPVLRCDPEKVNQYLNALRTGHFKLIVLSRQTFQSWANVARLTDSGIFFSLPQSPTASTDKTVTIWLFSHLLGHAFGLKDEELIVLAKNNAAVFVPDGPNCAPDLETAKKWWGDLVGKESGVGYFKGCSANPDYIKPTKGSLMNLNDFSSFQPTYGAVSERYLKKILDYCFSGIRPAPGDDPDFFAQYPEFKECVKQ